MFYYTSWLCLLYYYTLACLNLCIDPLFCFILYCVYYLLVYVLMYYTYYTVCQLLTVCYALVPLSVSCARLMCSKADSRTSHTYIITSLIYFIFIVLSLYSCILSILLESSIGLMLFLFLCCQPLLLTMFASVLALLVLPTMYAVLQYVISISTWISFVNKLILSMLYYYIIIKCIISLIVYESILSIDIVYVCMCIVAYLCRLRGSRLYCVVSLRFCGGQTFECERLEKKISLQSCVYFLVQNRKN